MKTTMKHYVPKNSSRENLLASAAEQSRMHTHTSNSFYDAHGFGGSYRANGEGVNHAD